ncbi:hypothetical protein D3C79_461980 [compost metagenome]
MGELLGEFGHDERHQANHHGQRHTHQHSGVDQRCAGLVLLALHLLQVVGQAGQHLGQVPGTFAGLDQRAVQASKRCALPGQAAGQAQAFGQ